MKPNTLLLYFFFNISLIYSCTPIDSEINTHDNLEDFLKGINNNPQYKSELKELKELRLNMYRVDFNYDRFTELRSLYLNQIEELVKSNKDESLKLGIIAKILHNDPIVNSKQKKLYLSKIDHNLFSRKLIDDIRSYFETPKYQIGDKLDVEEIYSYKLKSEIPLQLNSEINIIFFWSSWCANCHRYYIPINNLIEKYNNFQLNVIGISLDQNENNMKEYEKKHSFQFTSYSDLNKKWKSENAEKFGVKGIPACLVVDRDKKVLLVNPESKFLEDWIDGILNRK